MEKKLLILSAHQIQFLIGQERDVLLKFDLAPASAGLVPELQFALRLSADECRGLASRLTTLAAEAEGITPQ
jgi:hypothetical protein